MMEIVHANALDYIKQFDDDFFDIIILDPDYQDWSTLIENGLIDITMQKLKTSGNVLCFTKQPFDYDLRVASNKYFRREIVWTFENGGAWCSKKMPLISHQKIYWLIKSKDFHFNPRTGVPYSESTRNFKRTKKVFGDYEAEGRKFTKSEDGIWLRDHLHYNKPNSGKIPAKPVELVKILLKCFAPVDGNLCDPFAGSGIIPIIGNDIGLNVYSCDIDETRVMDILDKCFAETMKGESN